MCPSGDNISPGAGSRQANTRIHSSGYRPRRPDRQSRPRLHRCPANRANRQCAHLLGQVLPERIRVGIQSRLHQRAALLIRLLLDQLLCLLRGDYSDLRQLRDLLRGQCIADRVPSGINRDDLPSSIHNVIYRGG